MFLRPFLPHCLRDALYQPQDLAPTSASSSWSAALLAPPRASSSLSPSAIEPRLRILSLVGMCYEVGALSNLTHLRGLEKLRLQHLVSYTGKYAVGAPAESLSALFLSLSQHSKNTLSELSIEV